MNDWQYLKKLRQSERCSVVTVLAVVTCLVGLAAIICCVVKFVKGRNTCTCGCNDNDFDDDFDDDMDDDDDMDSDDTDGGTDGDGGGENPGGNGQGCDENGCCYTHDKDFV